MTLDVVLSYRTRRPWAPGPASLRRWARLAAGARRGELGIRVVGARESRALNARWRGRDAPTNVLSFPAAPELAGRQIGDIVVCAPVVAREAREQGKPLPAHWAHMVVHGTLHLLGFDHRRERDARRMEGRERVLLARLGLPDPY
ncbi:MAG TPA: rRNA maturation RNase YbeY, partial [Gemmatimonadales bacterium]|nr:rRNA maturation RNase YbeY [Gemmatimonadales bacterium]